MTGIRLVLCWTVLVSLVLTGCGATGSSGSKTKAITLYTCVNDTTIQPVITAFQAANPGVQVDLFRAPTGQLNARVASDARSGGLKADVIWACDPLTMADYVAQGLVGGWVPETSIPPAVQTADSVGVAVLYLVAVSRTGIARPTSWQQLSQAGTVAVPDPKVAASALGALGYLGPDFYAELKRHGAVQVSTPDDVTTGVAQGTYDVGMTIASSAYAAQKSGSPVEVTWPDPGRHRGLRAGRAVEDHQADGPREGLRQLRDQPGGSDRDRQCRRLPHAARGGRPDQT